MAIETTRRQILISTLVLSATACRRAEPDLAGYTEEEPPHLSSTIRANDPQIVPQLLSGWYPAEQNPWRWTARTFAVALWPPPGSAARGSILRVRLAVPEVLLAQLKSTTLSASIRGVQLAPETYRQPGMAFYNRDVPASAVSGDSVRVDFAVEKPFRPNVADSRELGVIVHNLSLETK